MVPLAASRTGDDILITWPPKKGTPSWLKVYEVTRLKDLKPKIRKEVEKLLDTSTPSVVEYAPVDNAHVHVTSMKPGVANHRVPHTDQTIVYRGNMQEFKDEIQRAYDNHPDEALHGKIELTNY